MRNIVKKIANMSNKEYHSMDGISSSAVKTVYKKSLAHWKGQKTVQSAAFAMGNAVHANLLEGEKNLVIKGPKTKTSSSFKAMKEALTEDQVLLTEVEFNVASRITKGALDNPVCSKILTDPDRLNEISIFVEDPVSKLMLKTRPDLMLESNKTVYDVKTTQDASPKGFLNECVKYGYFLQGAHYVYTCQLAGYDITDFAFIACEKASPYLSHLHLMGPEVMAWATAELHKTLAVIAKADEAWCYDTGWGDYTVMEKPSWI